MDPQSITSRTSFTRKVGDRGTPLTRPRACCTFVPQWRPESKSTVRPLRYMSRETSAGLLLCTLRSPGCQIMLAARSSQVSHFPDTPGPRDTQEPGMSAGAYWRPLSSKASFFPRRSVMVPQSHTRRVSCGGVQHGHSAKVWLDLAAQCTRPTLDQSPVTMCPIGAYLCHRGRLGWSGTSILRQNQVASTH